MELRQTIGDELGQEDGAILGESLRMIDHHLQHDSSVFFNVDILELFKVNTILYYATSAFAPKLQKQNL